ncbi:MAG TPA: hypothetical protein VFO52_09890 [Longimicrobiales bacterium]|nr:hypothetical protein [Longimicrobiales bacterium]
MTLRHGAPGKRYHMVDLDAPDMRAALMQAVNAFPPDAERTADLIEIRVSVDPERRDYTPE